MAKQPPVKPIWAADAAGLDPKRSYRFILYLDGIPSYFINSSGVPSFTVSDGGKHTFLGHEFKFPGSVKWTGTIDVKMVDTIDYNMAQKFTDYIRKAGYVYPSNFNESSASPEYYRKTISKSKFPFKQVKIQRLDAEGTVYETWVLNNPWISKVDFGTADYSSESLLNVTTTFTYDWAELRQGDSGNPPPFPA
jgi:hypothetical protein